MKKSLFILSCFVLLSVFTSCFKPKHKLRIVNNYPLALRITVGTTEYKTVMTNSTTSYKEIPEGTHQLSGDISGSATFKGRGKHNWTMTISSAGDFTVKEDK